MNITYGSPNLNCDDALLKKIGEILNSGWVSIGKHMEELEQHFKDRFHVKHAIACSCATTGLIIAIKAAGWKNQKVALPAFTWPSTLYALECNGNYPIFLDIGRESWGVDRWAYEPCHRLIAVDTFGNQWEQSDYIKENVIVDAAHGYGLPNLGKRGLAEVVSLSFTKVVTGTEGGMILTDDDELAETATELRRLSGRMEEINALIALESVKGYGYEGSREEYVIRTYKKNITIPYKCQHIPNATNNSVFSIMFEDIVVRDAVRIALAKAGCETKVYYDPLCAGLPNTDYLYQRILSLPIHAGVIEDQPEIIEIINTAGRHAGTPGKAYLTK
jgi:dTDP-4-amino-4,6-dideoxygalactose transaminase